ncbi:MAG: hypothetical protein KIS92_14915 [Planctomycetota bacterium]|nr:hypothetical protein [Planctomycetota bacterium]
MTLRAERAGRGLAWLCLAALAFSALLARGARAEEPAEGEDRRFPLEVSARDEDGDRLSFAWSQVSGPTKVRINEPNAPKTWFTTTVPGEYVFEIRVSDGKDEVARKKTWNITMPNIPPVAVIDAPDKAILGQKVVMDGKPSVDKDGKITEYQWTMISAPPNTKVKLSEKDQRERKFNFEPDVSGDYVFELKVSDGKDWSAATHATVKVASVNNKPIPELVEPESTAEIPVPPQQPVKPLVLGDPPKPDVSRTKAGAYKLGDIIVLDGSASSDPLGEEMQFFWRQIPDDKAPVILTLVPDKTSAKGEHKGEFFCPVWKVKVAQPGVYRFVLQVDAGKGRKPAFSEPVVFTVGGANRPPVASFKPKETSYEKGKAVTLDGSESKDDDGDRLEYFWGWSGKGNKPKNWVVDNGPRVQFIGEETGTYGIRLIVSDGKDKSAPFEQDIKVVEANRPPVIADLPENMSVVVGETVRIAAKVSDPDQDPVTLEWKVLSPPSLRLTKEALSANPLVFTPPDRQVYLFSVTASDGKLSSETKRVQVSATDNVNIPPTAIIRANTKFTVGEKVVLDASESSDPEKKRLTYTWKQESGPSLGTPPGPAENKWEVSPKEAGKYEVSLTVSDGASESRPTSHGFEALLEKKPNQPPIATVLPPVSLIAGEEILLNGAGSADPDKDPITWRWRVLEGEQLVKVESLDQPKLRVKTLAPGKARFELIVNDGQADSEPQPVELEIKARREPPIASIDGPLSGKAGEEIALSAGKSASSPGSTLEEFRWGQLADGGPPLGLRARDLDKQVLVFKPEKPGTYVFQLVVVDDKGMRSKPANWTVIVGDGAAPEEAKTVAAPPEEPKTAPEPVKPPEEAKTDLATAPEEPKHAETPEVKTAPAAEGAPVAVISDLVACEPGGEVTLDASHSTPGSGKAVEEYRWECVESPNGAKVSFGFLNRGKAKQKVPIELPKEGSYTFELKVSNGKQWSEPVRATVKTRPPNVPPSSAVVAMSNYTDQDLSNPAGLLKLPHVIKTDPRSNILTVEEGREVLLDGSGSTDPDKGPKALVYKWRQISGPAPESKSEDGPYLRFKPGRSGAMLWDLVVSDGKADSPAAQVKVQALKAGTLPVGVVPSPVIQSNIAVRGQPGGVIILDGSLSRINPATKAHAQYAWAQIGGDDLQLRPEQMAKDKVGLRIYHPGRYRFMLTIKDGEYYSVPTIVDVIVTDPSMKGPSEATPKQPEKHESGALLPPPRQPKVAQAPKPPPEEKPEPPKEPDKPKEPVRVPEMTVTSEDVPEKKTDEPKVVSQDPAPAPPEEKPETPAPAPAKPEPAPVAANLSGELADPNYRADDPLYQNRKKKLQSLAAMPGTEPQDQLIAALADKDKDLRHIAAATLVQRGMASTLALIGVLENGSAEAKGEAHWALKELSRESFGPNASDWRKWWASQTGLP